MLGIWIIAEKNPFGEEHSLKRHTLHIGLKVYDGLGVEDAQNGHNQNCEVEY